ncbi:MAG: ATP-dependent DNA ligase [Acidobacteria bacterium]|nr:ATP-dependent DNA ligase [Acidobacteriota bacterium]
MSPPRKSAPKETPPPRPGSDAAPTEIALPIRPPYLPMAGLLVAEIPKGPEWVYEPKWDGFRCLAFRDGDAIELQSKAGQPLARYFPEVVANVRSIGASRFVLDGEIVIPIGEELSFDDLLQRIHPAESRIRKLAAETPGLFLVFDLLVDEKGKLLTSLPMAERRRRLEAFAAKHLAGIAGIRLSPATPNLTQAQKWLRSAGGAMDGVIAKRGDFDYRSGDRTGMQKIKLLRTADCVVGGFRYASKGKALGSLLLGLYDGSGKLDHVGFCSGLTAALKKELLPQLEKLVKPPGFTGQAPGGPSRWSTERTGEWQPLQTKLVVEVQYDHFTGGRFRHGTRLLRFRPDKPPKQCTIDQVNQESRVTPMALLEGRG